MKLSSALSHFFGFYPHLDGEADSSKRTAGVTQSVSRDNASVLVFRGNRYTKESVTTQKPLRSSGGERMVFRGTAYTRSTEMPVFDAVKRRQAVRIFRGSVVPNDR